MGELAPFIILKGNMSHGAKHILLEFYRRRFLVIFGEEDELGRGIRGGRGGGGGEGGAGREEEEEEEEQEENTRAGGGGKCKRRRRRRRI